MCSRAPSLRGRYPASPLLRTQPPPSRLLSLSRFSPVIRGTLLHRFPDGTRTVSPVAQHVLVTVLPLPPRRRRHNASVRLRHTLLPSPLQRELGLRILLCRGHLWVHSHYGPVTRSPPQGRLCQLASSASFPPRMQPKLRGS